MDIPECGYYIPFNEVFRFCRFHDEEHLLRNGNFICQHPEAVGAVPCSNECIVRKKLEMLVTPVAKDFNCNELDENANSPLLF